MTPIIITLLICLSFILLNVLYLIIFKELFYVVDKRVGEYIKSKTPTQVEIPAHIQEQLDGLKSQLSAVEMARGMSNLNRR